ncbi:MAG: RagB/SusD family nutrient uptake outer membrane protein [Chitinophagaceae bacterium]
MKKFRLYITVILIITTISLQSCKKYLDEKSDKTLVVPQTADDLQALLDDNYTMNSQTPGFGETSSDDYFVQTGDYNSFSEFDQQAYTWRLTRYNYGNDWNYAYNAIFNANYALAHIDEIKRKTADELIFNNVKGSALFFRGYYFLSLCWEYAKAYDENSSSKDLGIILRLGDDFNVPSVRSSVAQSYKQVINDLMESLSWLPVNSQHPMRPSKLAAYATLSRTYLSMRKYDSAFKYADLALGINNELLDYNAQDVNLESDIPFFPFNKEIIFYTTESGDYTPKLSPYAFIDTTLYSLYDSNDIRKSIFFYQNGSYVNFKGSYSASTSPLFSGIATDEVLITRAESNARLGKIDEAVNDLNTLLIKRWRTGTFTPIVTGSPEDILKIILIERRKELLMRGLRWIDIKRLNKEGASIIPTRIVGADNYHLAPNENRYALPLPDDIIKLTGVSQN